MFSRLWEQQVSLFCSKRASGGVRCAGNTGCVGNAGCAAALRLRREPGLPRGRRPAGAGEDAGTSKAFQVRDLDVCIGALVLVP